MIKGRKVVVFSVLCLLVFGFLYRFSPRRLEFLGYYDKVFAHRVNSLEKQKQALYYFDGIELDLVYLEDKERLDVNHPPATSIDLNFDAYLEAIESKNFPFLWLDIKNLNTKNDVAIFTRLNKLFEAKGYPKNKVLIETPIPEALAHFTRAGYKTSYYLTPRLHQKTSADLKKEISNINRILELQPEIGISTSYEDYNIISRYFPNKTKYIWAISSPYKIKYSKVRRLLKDKTVAIVLTKFRSISGER